MKVEWGPILMIGTPTLLLLVGIIWVDFVVPRLTRRRRMLRRLGIEREHDGPNAKIVAMRQRYEDVQRARIKPIKPEVCG